MNSHAHPVRFAPSPTGAFHIGNFRTAWIAHEFARQLKAPWLVRFEDIDRPRVIVGAQERQSRELSSLGLKADQTQTQSEHYERHKSLFQNAIRSGSIYPCSCSRKEVLEAIAGAPHEGTPVYHGHCRDPRNRPRPTDKILAWRFAASDPSGKDDFIVGRATVEGAEFTPAYHWACAIDDFDSDPLLLVRAWDLAHAADLQKLIHHWVGECENQRRPYPAVFHTALVTQPDHRRLEKRTRGVTLEELSQRGFTSSKINSLFRASFERANLAQFEPGRIWGENRREITTTELGV